MNLGCQVSQAQHAGRHVYSGGTFAVGQLNERLDQLEQLNLRIEAGLWSAIGDTENFSQLDGFAVGRPDLQFAKATADIRQRTILGNSGNHCIDQVSSGGLTSQ
ncbi:hypothetical protein D9M73_225880 [compost metagenome]